MTSTSRTGETFSCPHEHVGTVTAGDHRTGAHASVAVCVLPSCIAAARRWAHAKTGKPAGDLVRFEMASHTTTNEGARR
ncbi:hypothetical protein M2280_005279 [Prescottella agglutinans]|uniref:Uncharacterized protein n=1 Tax=Prescottella agglutinans TaxID=1644129 RepID=A0ABT6MI79_9NOCA|nr:hypothetical protein [Prescottella agglutinans]